MRRRLVLALLLAFAIALPARAGTVTDAAGRTISLPGSVERVLAAGPPASVFAYVLN